MTELADLHRDYQILLEKHRLDPDCEETWELYRKTRGELEREWLEHLANAGA